MDMFTGNGLLKPLKHSSCAFDNRLKGKRFIVAILCFNPSRNVA